MSSSTSGIQQRIQQRKAQVAAIRTELRQRRQDDSSGLSCTNWLSDQIDGFVCDSFRQSPELFSGSLSDSWSLLAVGGNGRRRPAPFSDIDLLIVCDPRQQARLQPLVDVAMRDLWDAGVQPACTMKSIDEACDYAAGRAVCDIRHGTATAGRISGFGQHLQSADFAASVAV